MRKVILCAVLTMFGLSASAKEKVVWNYIDANLQKVFTIDASAKSNEILRMYDDGSYEHLKYIFKASRKEEVQRSLGTYQVRGLKIHFSNPEKKAFSGKFKYGSFFYNGKMYNSLVDMKVKKKNDLYKSTTDRKFFKPFFICLNSEEVVNNSEADEQLDLDRLMDYILEGKNSDNDKLMAIVQLIVGSVEYDYDAYYKDIYAHDQEDVKGILAGSKRLAVCAGYAHTMKTLCEMAGIKVDYVKGNTKQSISDLNQLGGYHAWNIAEVEGEKRLYDVTWADDGETIDMSWIDVEPSVMIGTHFPDRVDDQLLSSPVTQEHFLKSSVITPSVGSAAAISVDIPARIFAGNAYKLVLLGKHTVIATLIPLEGETGNAKHVGSGHYMGDSTYFTIPLTRAINPLEIEIDGQLEVQTIVFKGGQTDLMNYYISKVDTRNVDSYMKGVIAAIRLKDEVTLKKLVGASNPVFFDKKGKLKSDKPLVMACLDWTGDLNPMTQTVHTKTIKDVDGNPIEIQETVYHIEIPGKVEFTLDYDGEGYEIKGMEVL